MKAIGIIIAAMLAAPILATTQLVSAELSNVTVDISHTSNPGDYLVGITCEDPDYLYATLLNQGAIVKLDKDSRSVLGIFNDPSGNVAAARESSVKSVARAPLDCLSTVITALTRASRAEVKEQKPN